MKKIAVLMALVSISSASLACDGFTIMGGKLQKIGIVGNWLSRSPGDLCKVDNPEHASINWIIKVYERDSSAAPYGPANPINVNCNGKKYTVTPGNYFICKTSDSVVWANVDGSKNACGEASL